MAGPFLTRPLKIAIAVVLLGTIIIFAVTYKDTQKKEGLHLRKKKKQAVMIPAPDSQAAAAAMIRDLSRIHFLCPVGKTALIHDTGAWQCVSF